MSVLVLILVGVIFITITGSYVLENVSSPVRELSQFMGKVADASEEGKEIALFSRRETKATEEIAQMIDSYNAMAKRINDNIIKDYILELNQKQTELKMLQFQINPHFLYNALILLVLLPNCRRLIIYRRLPQDCQICSVIILMGGRLEPCGRNLHRQRIIWESRRFAFRNAFLLKFW